MAFGDLLKTVQDGYNGLDPLMQSTLIGGLGAGAVGGLATALTPQPAIPESAGTRTARILRNSALAGLAGAGATAGIGYGWNQLGQAGIGATPTGQMWNAFTSRTGRGLMALGGGGAAAAIPWFKPYGGHATNMWGNVVAQNAAIERAAAEAVAKGQKPIATAITLGAGGSPRQMLEDLFGRSSDTARRGHALNIMTQDLGTSHSFYPSLEALTHHAIQSGVDVHPDILDRLGGTVGSGLRQFPVIGKLPAFLKRLGGAGRILGAAGTAAMLPELLHHAAPGLINDGTQ